MLYVLLFADAETSIIHPLITSALMVAINYTISAIDIIISSVAVTQT